VIAVSSLLTIQYPSALQPQDAIQRLYAFGEYLQSLGINVVWNGWQASIHGKYKIVDINGTMTVVQGGVVVQAQDPGWLVRDKAKSWLQGKLAEYLNPTTPLQYLPRR
jgi:hypothetical protein